MDQNPGSSRNAGYGPNPPPYNLQAYEHSQAWMSNQVGKGKVAVVPPPGTYCIGMTAAEGGQAPPDYPIDLADSGFSDAAIRRGFIRKVYLTLMIQLLVTVGIIVTFLYWITLREWTLDNYWFSFSTMGVVLVLIIVLSCCRNIRRKVPLNFIALGLFTVAEGLMLGSVAVYFNAEAVLWAVGATALVSFALTLFAIQSKIGFAGASWELSFICVSPSLLYNCQSDIFLGAPPVDQHHYSPVVAYGAPFTKWDFTALSGSLWVFFWTLFSFGLLCAILQSQYLYILYACLGTLLFSLYLVFDTQLIVGGKYRKYEVSPEEYVFAALNLYLDIVSMFLLLLQLIGLCR